MQQVLFHLPILKETFPPNGLPINGFGVMLFVTFVMCVWFLTRWAKKTGTNLPRDRVQDLVIVGFIGGLVGARITFMIQYDRPAKEFLRIWEGGIVLYGGIISGVFAFVGFYYLFLKKAGVSFWKLVDAVGPTLALGIALGRVGCLLNGCCFGHVAPEDCPSLGFPLMTCPARDVVVEKQGYQTPTGFTVKPATEGIQSVVDRVEPGSNAERAGLQPGDRIIRVNGRPNGGVFLVVSDKPDMIKWATETAQEKGADVAVEPTTGVPGIKIIADDVTTAAALRTQLNTRLVFLGRVVDSDAYTDLIRSWPRGDQSLDLIVNRQGQEVHIGPFTPRTLGLHPTQLYETISMLLLMILLLAFYPYRRHDGQVFELFIVGYAVHRFLNEALRNDTDIVGIPSLHMTLSQNISVLMILFAIALEIVRRKWGNPQASPAQPVAIA